MFYRLDKNRAAVQRTSPSRLEMAFSNVLMWFTSPCFAQIFKSAQDLKPQQDFQRSSAPNLTSTWAVSEMVLIQTAKIGAIEPWTFERSCPARFFHDAVWNDDAVQLLQTQMYRGPAILKAYATYVTQNKCGEWCQHLLVKVALTKNLDQRDIAKQVSLVIPENSRRYWSDWFKKHLVSAFLILLDLATNSYLVLCRCRMKQIEKLNCSYDVCKIKAEGIQKKTWLNQRAPCFLGSIQCLPRVKSFFTLKTSRKTVSFSGSSCSFLISHVCPHLTLISKSPFHEALMNNIVKKH